MEFFKPVKPTVLVVNHFREECEWITEVLRPSYRVTTASDGVQAMHICQQTPPDLVLADVSMPDPDGYELHRRLQADNRTCDIPVIFLVGKTDCVNEQLAIDWGAERFIMRPLHPRLLMARVRAHFVEAAMVGGLCVDNEYLEAEVTRRLHQVNAMQNVTILALAALAEVRDVDTAKHLKRTQNYVLALGSYLVRHPRFAAELSGDRVQTLCQCAPLHDIGKVGIPDRILLKQGSYTPDEFEIMKTHTRLGLDAIEAVQSHAELHLDFLTVAKEIVFSHHEKWDGSGYPQGLAGDAIPVSARLMALADVYDGLISRRVYKPGYTHEQACDVILKGRGKHFDPDVVDAFMALSEVFQGIAKRYADTDRDLQRKARLMAQAGQEIAASAVAACRSAELDELQQELVDS
ncbi:response regulator [Rhodoferax sp. 4810]|nr:response regulator [Rhodoferax jenense]